MLNVIIIRNEVNSYYYNTRYVTDTITKDKANFEVNSYCYNIRYLTCYIKKYLGVIKREKLEESSCSISYINVYCIRTYKICMRVVAIGQKNILTSKWKRYYHLLIAFRYKLQLDDLWPHWSLSLTFKWLFTHIDIEIWRRSCDIRSVVVCRITGLFVRPLQWQYIFFVNTSMLKVLISFALLVTTYVKIQARKYVITPFSAEFFGGY